MEIKLLKLELKNGRLPIYFANGHTRTRVEGENLIIECDDSHGLEQSMGYKQFTIYYVPQVNVQYFGPDVPRRGLA